MILMQEQVEFLMDGHASYAVIQSRSGHTPIPFAKIQSMKKEMDKTERLSISNQERRKGFEMFSVIARTSYSFRLTAVTARCNTTKIRIIRPTTMVVHSAGTPKSEVSGSIVERTSAPTTEPST